MSWRRAAFIAAAGGVVACGGGGSGITNPQVGSVTVDPAFVTVRAGEKTTLTAVVEDNAGHVVPRAKVTWSSLDASVASVSSQGEVTGVAVGNTRVAAKSGSEADTAEVQVIAGVSRACDSVQAVPSWDVHLTFAYEHSGTVNATAIHVTQSGDFTAELNSAGGSGVFVWNGAPGGRGSKKESADNSTGSTRIEGGGQLLYLPAEPRSRFSLIINTATCTYQFGVSPAITATRTVTTSTSSVSKTGTYFAGVIDISRHELGDWRHAGLSQSRVAFDAHNAAASALLLLNPDQNIYTPPDIGQYFWTNSSRVAQGTAVVSYDISPNLP